MRARILVVEDNATNLELMVYLLHAFGYETETAIDGAQGLEKLGQASYDLVICDLQMPNVDGYEFARRIRADAQRCRLPLVAVSAYAMVGDREKILASGFDGYISKPIDPENFVQRIERILPAELKAEPRAAQTSESTASETLPPAHAMVLVVDDSLTNLALVRSILQPSGFEVVAVTGVRQARQSALRRPPDLFICDLHMSPDDGLDFLHWVKNERSFQGVPFIMLTSSYSGGDDRSRALELGVDRFLSRPIDPRALLNEIQSCLQETKGQHQRGD